MRLTDQQLDAIEQKAKAASPGNWYTVDRIWLPRDSMTYVIAGHHDPHVGSFVCDVGEVDEWDDENTYDKQAAQKEADAKFIAAADLIRVEALVQEVRRLRRHAGEPTICKMCGKETREPTKMDGDCLYCPRCVFNRADMLRHDVDVIYGIIGDRLGAERVQEIKDSDQEGAAARMILYLPGGAA